MHTARPLCTASPGARGGQETPPQTVPTPDVTGSLLLRTDHALIGHVIPGLTEPRFPGTDSNLSSSCSLRIHLLRERRAGEQLNDKNVKPHDLERRTDGERGPGDPLLGRAGVGGSFEDPEGMSALKDNLVFGGGGWWEAEG